MCTAQTRSVSNTIGSDHLFDNQTMFGKVTSRADPLGSYAATGDEERLDPIEIRQHAPKIPGPPPPMQSAYEADTTLLTRRNRARQGTQGGSLLTGGRGVADGALAGAPTLLGG